MRAHHGIDLDGLLPSLATAADESGRCAARYVGDVPPALQLGGLPGHAPKLDAYLPIDPRGSGISLATATIDQPGSIAARLPIAYAWELLLGVPEDGPPPTWAWPQLNKSTGSITPGSAIAAAVRDLCIDDQAAEEGDSKLRSTRTLVVPNLLREHHQDHLLRALRLEVASPRLLWRPIAAALSWLDNHGDALADNPQHLNTVGSLLHLHLGSECWEATLIELVQYIGDDDRTWVLPGRRLRDDDVGAPLRGAPMHWLEQTAGMVQTNGAPPTDARRWNMLWASAWSRAMLLREEARSSARAALPPWIPPELCDNGRRHLAGAIYAMQAPRDPSAHWQLSQGLVPPRSNDLAPDTWLQKIRASALPTRLLGAVVTGPYAALQLNGGGVLGPTLVARVRNIDQQSILVEGISESTTAICARGAAEFGRRSALGLPTYLDTLPAVSMIAMVHGEPEWINVLETKEPWVMGSQMWSKEPEKTRFLIPKGERELTVAVHRGGSPTCRKATTKFALAAEVASPVSLHVSITPGQGAPRIEVRPDDRHMLQGRSLTLDWATAEDTGRTETEELEAVDRICPRHEPRFASTQKWALHRFQIAGNPIGIRDLIKLFLHGRRRVTRSNGATDVLLDLIKTMLKQWDHNINLGWATAVSSECSLHEPTHADTELLDEFIKKLDALAGRDCDESKDSLRILAAMSADTSQTRKRLELFLSRGHAHHHDPSWMLAGHCARDPEHCRRLIEIAALTATYNAYKQAARVLMFRRDALATTPAATAGRLLLRAAADAETHSHRGQFQQAFQECTLLCAYLLRARIYHPDFASPETPEFRALETTFQKALLSMRSGHVMGGVIDKNQLAQDILDYARRQGRGRLVVYAQDSSD